MGETNADFIEKRKVSVNPSEETESQIAGTKRITEVVATGKIREEIKRKDDNIDSVIEWISNAIECIKTHPEKLADAEKYIKPLEFQLEKFRVYKSIFFEKEAPPLTINQERIYFKIMVIECVLQNIPNGEFKRDLGSRIVEKIVASPDEIGDIKVKLEERIAEIKKSCNEFTLDEFDLLGDD